MTSPINYWGLMAETFFIFVIGGYLAHWLSAVSKQTNRNEKRIENLESKHNGN